MKINFRPCTNFGYVNSELNYFRMNYRFGFGWLVVLGLTALGDSISVYIGPSPKERDKEERKDR